MVSETFKCSEARYLWTATTENKITTPKHKLIIVVIIFDSTTSVPIQGIALIRLVILFSISYYNLTINISSMINIILFKYIDISPEGKALSNKYNKLS